MKEEQEDDEEWMLEGDGGGGMSNDALRGCFAHFRISKQ